MVGISAETLDAFEESPKSSTRTLCSPDVKRRLRGPKRYGKGVGNVEASHYQVDRVGHTGASAIPRRRTVVALIHFGLDDTVMIPSGRVIQEPACKMWRFTFKTASSRDPSEVTCPKCKKTSAFLKEKREWSRPSRKGTRS